MAAFKSKKYSWRDGFRPCVKAEIVGEVFSEIEERDGSVTSKSFLDASRDEDSPTHPLFEWDDTVAAEKWRMRQSQGIIGHLQIEVVVENMDAEESEIELEITEVSEPEVRRIPAYANVNPFGRFGSNKTTTGSYVNIESVMSNDDMRKVVLENVLNELSVYQRKYFMYQELKEIFEAIESV